MPLSNLPVSDHRALPGNIQKRGRQALSNLNDEYEFKFSKHPPPAVKRSKKATLRRKESESEKGADEMAPVAVDVVDKNDVGVAAKSIVNGKSAPVKTDGRLPVTILSGFLGSGKTTLLEHILRSKDHGMRCAVIVNDMGELNIDAELVRGHDLVQKEEKVVQLENGCICCTLREDLLDEVARLSESGEFDYLVIESTGVSEPQQVAESFSTAFLEQAVELARQDDGQLPEGVDAETMKAITAINDDNEAPRPQGRMAELLAKGGLTSLARLDTCVSVIDCLNVMNDFETTDFLSDRPVEFRGGELDPEDERNVTDLLVDQIEFADVILLNKIDLCDKKTVATVEKLVRKLNPGAHVVRTVRCSVDLKHVLNTGRFDFEKAVLSAGWLQSLKEMIPRSLNGGATRIAPKPETEEYGISSFVYRARAPFSPRRLWDLMCRKFVIIQNAYEDLEEEEDGEEEKDEEEENEDEEDIDGQDDRKDEEEMPQLNPKLRLTEKKACPVFGPLLRSKGFLWLATRPTLMGEWSQAGVMATLTGSSNWLCCDDLDVWSDGDPQVKKAILNDMKGEWGDRRQEIVFIGGGVKPMDEAKIRAAFDSALLTDEEMKEWEETMRECQKEKELDVMTWTKRLQEIFEDGWENWLDVGEIDGAHDHDHAHHEH